MTGLDRVKVRRVVVAQADLGLFPPSYVDTVVDRLETCVVEDPRIVRVKALAAAPAVDEAGFGWVRQDALAAALAVEVRVPALMAALVKEEVPDGRE